MITLTFGEKTLDLETIHGPSELLNLIDSIEPQDKLRPTTMRPKGELENELLFDELTPKEIALRNLVEIVIDEYELRKEEMFPPEARELWAIKQNGKMNIDLPAVDSDKYHDLQKLGYMRTFIESYLSTLIQSRVGFGARARVDTDGKIYILKDLRELYKLA